MNRTLTFALPCCLSLSLVACEDAPPDEATPVARWTCPEGWVESAHGGCGPAVILCASGGGAAPHACDGVDLFRPTTIPLADGGVVQGFHRLRDGGIGGAWPELGAPGGPPGEAWLPDAITRCIEGGLMRDDGTCGLNVPENCPVGSAGVPGGRCTQTAECPAEAYASPDADAVGAVLVHVRAGALSSGADGSAARPYATIEEGLRRAGDGGWVLVAEGTYDEAVRLSGGARAHILGACAAHVTVHGRTDPGATGATIELRGDNTSLDLRGVKVTGPRTGVSVLAGASLRATGAVFTESQNANVSVVGAGARAELTSCLVYDPDPTAGPANGRGVVARAGARVELTEVAVTNNVGIGVLGDEAMTRVLVRRSAVRGTRAGSDGNGFGLRATNGAALEVTETLIAGNATTGVQASGPGAEASITTCRVRGSLPAADVDPGYGLVARDGAHLRMEGVIVDANRSAGVVASGAATRVEVRDGLVRDTLVGREGTSGYGLQASAGATVEISRAVFEGNSTAGVSAIDPGTRVTLDACVVRDTLRDARGLGGIGIHASTGAALQAVGCTIHGNAASGMHVVGATLVDGGVPSDASVAAATLRGSLIRGALPKGGGATSFGISASNRARVSVSRVQVLGCTGVGIYTTFPGTRLDIASSVVRGTRGYDGRNFGRGVEANNGSVIRANGLLVEDSREIGVAIVDGGTSLVGTDVLIRGVRPAVRGFGVGLYTFSQGRTALTRLAVVDVFGAGLVAVPRPQYPRSSVSVADLYVRDVGESTVQFNQSGMTESRVGDPVSYGLHAGLGATVDVSRAVIEDVGYGFYNASGAMFIRQGVIGQPRVRVGAFELPVRSGGDGRTLLESVTRWGHQTSEILNVATGALAEVRGVESPTAIDDH